MNIKKYLKKEYPHGVDLVYIDYRDSFEDNIGGMVEVLKEGYMEDHMWQADCQWNSIKYTQRECEEKTGKELTSEEKEEMTELLYEMDTSTPEEDLLKNTSDKLFFIELDDEVYINESNEEVIQKYAQTKEEKKEIEDTIKESFYDSNISFYFYLNPLDVFKVLQKEDWKYIVIDGAYFSTITRGNGSNWLGENAIFSIQMKREDFIKNFYADRQEGQGYSWHEIAMQTGFEQASIYGSNKVLKNTTMIQPTTTEDQKREQELAKKWKDTGECTFGDMNYKRHNEKEYSNNFPCGWTCKECSTFWID